MSKGGFGKVPFRVTLFNGEKVNLGLTVSQARELRSGHSEILILNKKFYLATPDTWVVLMLSAVKDVASTFTSVMRREHASLIGTFPAKDLKHQRRVDVPLNYDSMVSLHLWLVLGLNCDSGIVASCTTLSMATYDFFCVNEKPTHSDRISWSGFIQRILDFWYSKGLLHMTEGRMTGIPLYARRRDATYVAYAPVLPNEDSDGDRLEPSADPAVREQMLQQPRSQVEPGTGDSEQVPGGDRDAGGLHPPEELDQREVRPPLSE